ncbi:MAG: PHP domain-containing protein [Oscillospiraceae bacterium]|nr:PHP domain-containing protein [Oscillospiraceae bacterium]
MKLSFDTHTHSNISDGGNSPAEMLAAAQRQGLSVLALTDHFDLHEHYPRSLSPFDRAGTQAAYDTLTQLKHQNCDSRVIFAAGIEIGQAHQYREFAESWLNAHNYDYVLGSCHIIRNHCDFYHMDYTAPKNHPDKVLTQYFAELIELCEWAGKSGDKQGRRFDALSHLTYPLRYMNGRGSTDKHTSSIDKLFTVMAKYEIALEINTQSFAQGMICPDLPQVARFRELGGRLVTVGSDSHSADTLAQGLNMGLDIARAAGFAECAYYIERQPRFIRI